MKCDTPPTVLVVAQAIHAVIDDRVIHGRIGGEEFAVLWVAEPFERQSRAAPSRRGQQDSRFRQKQRWFVLQPVNEKVCGPQFPHPGQGGSCIPASWPH